MSVEIIYKEENEEKFWEYWEKYTQQRKTSSRYLPISIEHNLLFSRLSGRLYEDKSFVYVVNKEPAACVFLPIEKRDGLYVMTGAANDSYIDAPLCDNGSIRKKVFSIIDDIAQKNDIKKIAFIINAIDERETPYNYLQQYGYLDMSILKYVIDLEHTDDLLKACRRGHRCDIKNIIKDGDFKAFFINKENADYDKHEEYRQLHYKCAGRETRPKETFDMQFEKLKQGVATLVGLEYKKKVVAYAYFDHTHEAALYYSGADDPDYDNLHLYHAILFFAAEYFQKRGIKYIDMEQPSSPSQQVDYYPDKKQLNIALFKRGFPGSFVSSFRGIKYLSKDLFEKENKEFANKYEIPTIK